MPFIARSTDAERFDERVELRRSSKVSSSIKSKCLALSIALIGLMCSTRFLVPIVPAEVVERARSNEEGGRANSGDDPADQVCLHKSSRFMDANVYIAMYTSQSSTSGKYETSRTFRVSVTFL